MTKVKITIQIAVLACAATLLAMNLSAGKATASGFACLMKACKTDDVCQEGCRCIGVAEHGSARFACRGREIVRPIKEGVQ